MFELGGIDNQANLDLELMQDELEYLQLTSNFFEDQTEIWGELVNKVEFSLNESLKVEQELIKVFNERKIEKEKLISHLKALKDQYDIKASQGMTKIISKNGYFECPECPMKSIWKECVNRHIKTIHRKLNIVHKFQNCPECHKSYHYLKSHINAVHRKLRLYKCSDCDKGLSDYTCAFQKIFIIFFFFI